MIISSALQTALREDQKGQSGEQLSFRECQLNKAEHQAEHHVNALQFDI